MRRIIPLMLIAAMLLSMGLNASATQATEAGSTNVTAGYVAGEEGGQIISVELEWEGMEFTYNGESKPVWDPENHQYVGGSEAGWAESNASISVTNHSNVILQAGINYSSESGYEDMELAFTDVNPFVGSAETSDGAGAECEIIIRAIPMGSLAPNTKTGTKVGEIKVTVVPVDDPKEVLASLADLYGEVPVKSANVLRGEAYFETDADKQLAADTFDKANTAISNENSSDAEKNLALNAFLTAYYNELYLMQDQAAS